MLRIGILWFQVEVHAGGAREGAFAVVVVVTRAFVRRWLCALVGPRVFAPVDVEKELVLELKRNWRGPLVKLYGLTEGPDATRQLKRAESWLRTRGEDADLLLASARLCLRAELWGKARSYLETVIGIRPSPEVFKVYGRLLSQLGDTEAAADAFREGLNLVSDSGDSSMLRLTANQADTPKPPRLEDSSV